LREQFLADLGGDRLVLTDASATAGIGATLGGRVRTSDLERVTRTLRCLAPGAMGMELLSGEVLSPALRLGESPLGRLEAIGAAHPGLLTEATLDASNGLGTRPVPETVLREAAAELGRAGVSLIRVRDAGNRTDRLQAALAAASRTDALVEACAVLPGDVAASRVESIVELLKKLAGLGAAVIGLEDPRGALRPMSAYALVRTLRRELPAVPIRLRSIETVGTAVATVTAAAEGGLGGATVVALPLARPGAPPAATAVCAALAGTERAPALVDTDLGAIATTWRVALAGATEWVTPRGELETTPPDLPTRESVPPRPAAELEALLREVAEGTTTAERRREAVLEAHDPAAYAERRVLVDRYGALSPLSTRLFVSGMRAGEETTLTLPNGQGEHKVALRACEGREAAFLVDGAEVRVELGG
jgi:pyruvate carboxylase